MWRCSIAKQKRKTCRICHCFLFLWQTSDLMIMWITSPVVDKEEALLHSWVLQRHFWKHYYLNTQLEKNRADNFKTFHFECFDEVELTSTVKTAMASSRLHVFISISKEISLTFSFTGNKIMKSDIVRWHSLFVQSFCRRGRVYEDDKLPFPTYTFVFVISIVVIVIVLLLLFWSLLCCCSLIQLLQIRQ